MFKNAEQVHTFINHLEKFINSSIYYSISRSKGLDRAANDLAKLLNKEREQLEMFIEVAAGITTASNLIPVEGEYLCPDCNSEMRLRTNKSNGEKFYGCKKYPECRGTRDSEGLSKQERYEKKYKTEQVAQADGFSFNRDKRNPVTEVSPPEPEVKTGWVNPFKK